LYRGESEYGQQLPVKAEKKCRILQSGLLVSEVIFETYICFHNYWGGVTWYMGHYLAYCAVRVVDEYGAFDGTRIGRGN
jgi:hypothetical protein